MRLIDADKLCLHLVDWQMSLGEDEVIGRSILDEFIEAVNEQPTAYSVEKVMAELEENGQKMSEAKAIRPYAKHSPSDHRYYKAISVKKAVDIVRNGGKE